MIATLVLPEKAWLSPRDLARVWKVNPRTARARLLAMDRELHGTLLARSGGKKRKHIRVSAEKLGRYMNLRAQTVPSETVRLIRSMRCRIRELEELVAKEIEHRSAE